MVNLFKALSEEPRLRIIALLLTNKEMCVCEFEQCLNMTQSNVSRHLTNLKQCNILDSYKKAQWAYYLISDSFHRDHKELYDYLQRKVKELPTYQKDQEEYARCKEIDICKNEVCPEDNDNCNTCNYNEQNRERES